MYACPLFIWRTVAHQVADQGKGPTFWPQEVWPTMPRLAGSMAISAQSVTLLLQVTPFCELRTLHASRAACLVDIRRCTQNTDLEQK